MKKLFTILFVALMSVSMSAKLVQQDIALNAASWGWGYNTSLSFSEDGVMTCTLTGEWGAASTGWDPEVDLSGWDKIIILVDNMSGCDGEWFKLKAYLRDKSESEDTQLEGMLGLDAEDNQQNYLVIDLHQEKEGFDMTKARILAIQCQPNGAIFKVSKVYLEKEEEDLPAAPETAPEVPTHIEADVMALFCNHYAENNLNFETQGWGGVTWETLSIDGTDIKACTAMTWEAMTNWGADHYDVSAFENLHADLWVPAAAKIKLTFEALGENDGGSGYKNGVVFDLVAGWNAIEAKLSDWPDNYNFADMRYLMFEGFQTPAGGSFEGNPLAFANIYFWKESTAVEHVTADTKTVKVIRDGQIMFIKNGKIYNALGAELH